MPIDATTRRALLRANWREVGLRLTAYASWRAGNLRWRRGDSSLLAAGKAPEDLASEAIEKVLSGERRWDPGRGELLPYLRGVVDSLASHLAESQDNRRYAELEDHIAEHVGRSDRDGAVDSLKITALRGLLRSEGQDVLLEVIDAVTLHCEARPKAIAEALGTSVADVNNRLKRLRRYALRVVAELKSDGGTEATHG